MEKTGAAGEPEGTGNAADAAWECIHFSSTIGNSMPSVYDRFTLVSDFSLAGDQARAIAELTEGLERGDAHQVLLGVTGSGKTFTMAQTISRVNRPTLVMVHNKTLAAQLFQEFRQIGRAHV